jgi:hypothetical protein
MGHTHFPDRVWRTRPALGRPEVLGARIIEDWGNGGPSRAIDPSPVSHCKGCRLLEQQMNSGRVLRSAADFEIFLKGCFQLQDKERRSEMLFRLGSTGKRENRGLLSACCLVG